MQYIWPGKFGSGARGRTDDVLLCQRGLQQRDVAGLDASPLLTPGIFTSCLLGRTDMAQDGGCVSGRGTRGGKML